MTKVDAALIACFALSTVGAFLALLYPMHLMKRYRDFKEESVSDFLKNFQLHHILIGSATSMACLVLSVLLAMVLILRVFKGFGRLILILVIVVSESWMIAQLGHALYLFAFTAKFRDHEVISSTRPSSPCFRRRSSAKTSRAPLCLCSSSACSSC